MKFWERGVCGISFEFWIFFWSCSFGGNGMGGRSRPRWHSYLRQKDVTCVSRMCRKAAILLETVRQGFRVLYLDFMEPLFGFKRVTTCQRGRSAEWRRYVWRGLLSVCYFLRHYRTEGGGMIIFSSWWRSTGEQCGWWINAISITQNLHDSIISMTANFEQQQKSIVHPPTFEITLIYVLWKRATCCYTCRYTKCHLIVATKSTIANV